MSLASPLAGPGLPTLIGTTTGNRPPQAPLGIALTVSADGTLCGPAAWPVHAGDTFAVRLSGALFDQAVVGSAALSFETPAGPQIVPGSLPEGGIAAGLVFRVEGRRTRAVLGWLPAQIRVYCGDSAPGVVADLCFYVGPPVDAGTTLMRGEATTLTISLAGPTGPYDLSALNLVWTLGLIEKRQDALELTVDVAGGVVTVPLAAADTQRLVAGPARWLLTDLVANRPVAGQDLEVL